MQKNIPISEMKRKNKEAGLYFFQKGNPRVEGKYGNYLITKSFGGDGYVVYEYNNSDGSTRYVESFESKASAVNHAKGLNK